MKTSASELKVLAIDIGGSHVKATILNSEGKLTMDYEKVDTPDPADPKAMLSAIKTLIKKFPAYNKVSVGFPGYVRNGVVITAPNLGTKAWANFDLQNKLEDILNTPVHVVNDADMQGLGVAAGKGFEMVLTLGTGFGTAFLMDGFLLPHMEIAHHPVSKNRTYDQYIGDKALKKKGDEKWNERMEKVLEILKTVFNYDHLYIGGGNARHLTLELDDNMTIVTNEDGIKGGSRLWQMPESLNTATARKETDKQSTK